MLLLDWIVMLEVITCNGNISIIVAYLPHKPSNSNKCYDRMHDCWTVLDSNVYCRTV